MGLIVEVDGKDIPFALGDTQHIIPSTNNVSLRVVAIIPLSESHIITDA